MFELIAYILIVSITFSFAFNRFEDFPGEAERANFLQVCPKEMVSRLPHPLSDEAVKVPAE